MSAISTATTSSVPRLLVTTSPHIQSGLSASRVMWDVNLAMLPALVMATHNFGLRAALVIGLSVAGAVAAEFLIQNFCCRSLQPCLTAVLS